MSDDRRTEAGGWSSEAGGSKLDAAIDGAVRQMLDVDQPSGLRGRVMQRIEERALHGTAASGSFLNPVASAFRRNLLWTALPIAAAATFILAVSIPLRTGAPTPISPAPPQIAAVESPPVPGPAAPDGAGSSAMPPRTRTRPSPPRAVVRHAASTTARVTVDRAIVAAAVPSHGDIEIDPLDTIDPIRVVPVGPVALEYKEVVVPPLAVIAQLQTAPLSTPDGRF